jgi:hypothetical protein
MPRKESRNAEANATRASVRKEMAQPRTSRSARVGALKLDATRNAEPPSTTVSGTVDKIIPRKKSGSPEKAQIAVNKSEHGHRNIRIKNELTDEHGDEVKLKKGAHVDVTVAAEPKYLDVSIDENPRPTRRKKTSYKSRRRNS